MSVQLSATSLSSKEDWVLAGTVAIQGWTRSPTDASDASGNVIITYSCGGPRPRRTLSIPFDMDITSALASCANIPLVLTPISRSFFVGEPPFSPQNRTFTLSNPTKTPILVNNMTFRSDAASLFTVCAWHTLVALLNLEFV
jgi:hypothetical protein